MGKSYETFYHIVLSEVCQSYEITPVSFHVKKTPCVGKPRFFLFLWEKELAAAQFKLTELIIIEFGLKLFDLETDFVSNFSLLTLQKDCLLKWRHHPEKYGKKLCLKKLKKIRKLASNEDLYFAFCMIVIINIFV